MFNPLRSTTIGALEKTVAFTERRHAVLAGNLANMSTPDYRARDLDVDAFQTALADSIKADRAKPAVRSGHGDLGDGAIPSPESLFRQAVAAMSSPGGNSSSPGPVGDGPLGYPGSESLSDPSLDDNVLRSWDSRTGVVGPTSASTRDDALSGPRSPMEAIVYHDGSDISMEQQVTQMSKNKHLHSLAITTMRSQFELLRAAITERA